MPIEKRLHVNSSKSGVIIQYKRDINMSFDFNRMQHHLVLILVELKWVAFNTYCEAH